MTSSSFILPPGLTFQLVSERLSSKGFSVVSRASHEGASLRGVGGSYLVVTADELGQLRDLAKQVESARRRAVRGHGSHISAQHKQQRDQAVASLRQTRDLLVHQLRDAFTQRILSVIKRSELIQEDYFTANFIERAGAPMGSADSDRSVPGTSQAQDSAEACDWEEVKEPTPEELESIEAQGSQTRSCSIQ